MLVGNRFDDAKLLQTAKVLEDMLDVPSVLAALIQDGTPFARSLIFYQSIESAVSGRIYVG